MIILKAFEIKTFNKKLVVLKRKVLFLIFILLLFCIFNNIIQAETYNEDLTIHSKKVIMMDYETGQILYTNGAQDKVFPASTTKILTALLVLEKGSINDNIVASKSAILSIPPESSTSNIRVGEVMKIKDVLYCLLLQSANEAGNVLAEYVSGNVPDFIKLMNEKAKEIGCNNTNFTSAHGFHDDNHYTTPEDMMIILRYAMKNQDFRNVMETKYYTVEPTNMTPTKRDLKNSNRLLFTQEELGSLGQYYQYALGGKTGYTIEAQRTFVGYAKKDNKLLLVGTFGSLDVAGKDGRFLDCVTLFEYGFNNFEYNNVIKKNDFIFEIQDYKNHKKYTVGLNQDVSMLMNNKYSNKISYDINLSPFDNITDAAINQEVGSINLDILNGNANPKISKSLILLDVNNILNILTFKQNILSKDLLMVIRFIAFVLFIISLAFVLLYKIFNRTNPANKYYAKHYNKIKKYLDKEDDIVFNKSSKK